MAKKYDLVVATGTYTNKDGQDKTQWLNVGKVLEKQNGGLVIKIDCIPTSVIDRDGNSVAWDGWLQMFEAKPREGQGSAPAKSANRDEPPVDDFLDRDIPFNDPYKFNSLMV